MPARSTNRTIVVAGALARRSRAGGHAWVFLQYLLGFRRLGYDVLFVDRVDEPAPDDAAALAEMMATAGLGASWALLGPTPSTSAGRSRRDVAETLERAVLLLNVMGYLDDPELRDRCGLRVFLDIDPGFGQIWRANGDADVFVDHDRHVTVGTNLGRTGCALPTAGIDWLPTVPPVVLDEWPPTPATGPFTTIGAWRGPFAPLEHDGTTYGLRAHAFRELFPLPALTGEPFLAALDIDPAERRDLDALGANGWTLADPRTVAATPAAYRGFVQAAGPELMVAKHAYSASACGWISDRSVCFLASGHPVLASETGTSELLTGTEGYVTFTDLESAARGVRAIRRDPARHATAARRLAETVFASDVVLGSMLDRLDVDGPRGPQ